MKETRDHVVCTVSIFINCNNSLVLRYWPVIDDALRRAVIERGVEVKLLAAALHFVPQTLRFLKSLESLNGMNPKGSIQVVRSIYHFHFKRDAYQAKCFKCPIGFQ